MFIFNRRISFASTLILLSISMLAKPTEAQSQQPVIEDDPFYDPIALLLTWQQDPTTTMTIDWHTIDENRLYVEYRTGGSDWTRQSGETHPFPHSERIIHRAELTGLEPGTSYDFRFGEGSKIYSFRTMPKKASRPLRIAVGGDIKHRQVWMEKTANQAMKFDLDFVMFGGDIAYADGLTPEEQRQRRQRDPQTPFAENLWYTWFDAYKNSLITDDYRVVPVLVSIGNHEVRGSYLHRENHRTREGFPPYTEDDESRERIAPYFYNLFAMPGQPGYNVLDFGDYMSVIMLDTEHTNTIEGTQSAWLRDVLEERQNVPHVFPFYHIPAYPSVRNYNDSRPTKIRENWVPLFEEFGLRVVFENHDHAYKRTHPIRNGEIASDGVVYVGDGAWGSGTRRIGRNHDYEAWYLDEAHSKRHFILLTVHGPHHHMIMIDSHGNIIDEYPDTPTFEPVLRPTMN